MQVEVYADVIFVINLIMDFFILWIVCKISKVKSKIYKLLISAFLMSIMYCLKIFVPFLYAHNNFIFSFLMVLVGVIISFSPKNIKDFIKFTILMHVSAFAVGGMGMALFYYTKLPQEIGNHVVMNIENATLKILIASICGFYILIKLFVYWFDNYAMKQQVILDVCLFVGEEKAEITGLIDTGNSLTEPISGKTVIIAEFSAVKQILPEKLRLLYYENEEQNLDKVIEATCETNFTEKIKMIPFKSIGKENGMLIGFKADSVLIADGEKKIHKNDMIIGIYNLKLSENGLYNGLLSPLALA